MFANCSPDHNITIVKSDCNITVVKSDCNITIVKSDCNITIVKSDCWNSAFAIRGHAVAVALRSVVVVVVGEGHRRLCAGHSDSGCLILPLLVGEKHRF